MNWGIWAKKLLYNGVVALLPVLIASASEIEKGVGAAVILIVLRQLQNWLKHK